MGEPEFTSHALDQMQYRGISKEQVIFALNHELERRPGKRGTVKVYGRTRGGILKIFTTPNKDKVISAMWEAEDEAQDRL